MRIVTSWQWLLMGCRPQVGELISVETLLVSKSVMDQSHFRAFGHLVFNQKEICLLSVRGLYPDYST